MMAETSNGTIPKKANGNVNKMELVRQALKRLGSDAKPLEIQASIKKVHQVELSADLISNYKSAIRNEQAKKASNGAAKQASPKPVVQPSVAQQHTSNGTASTQRSLARNGAAFSLEEIQAVKSLVGRVGAREVKSLIDLVGS